MPERIGITLVVGADHFGLALKNTLRDHLRSCGFEVTDLGVETDQPIDYPDIGVKVAEAVSRNEFSRGILVCGTGAGMAITANKVAGVRAVCVSDPYTAERAIASNDARIITFGQQITGPEVAKILTDIWLRAEFQGGRSTSKVKKIDDLDRKFRETR
jgi:ribose 5-phosphate isomerase B